MVSKLEPDYKAAFIAIAVNVGFMSACERRENTIHKGSVLELVKILERVMSTEYHTYAR